jgi:circadian clock protein KaiC
MRGGNHSKDIREYIITDEGLVVILPRTTDYDGLVTGIPIRTGPRAAQQDEAAPEPKAKTQKLRPIGRGRPASRNDARGATTRER